MSEYDDNPHDEMISRLYRLGSSGEPPAHLDRKILYEAERAVGRRQWVRVWPSLATAAVLVLSFTLLLRVMEQQPLEQTLLPDEMIETDTDNAQAPLAEEKESGVDAAADGIKISAPAIKPPAQPAAPRKSGAVKSKGLRSSMESDSARKGVVVEKRPVSASEEQLRYKRAEPEVGSVVGGMQADEAAIAPFVAPPAEVKKQEAVSMRGECGVELPAAELPIGAWQQLHKELLAQGKIAQARCLSETFEQRFGYKLELSQKP